MTVSAVVAVVGMVGPYVAGTALGDCGVRVLRVQGHYLCLQVRGRVLMAYAALLSEAQGQMARVAMTVLRCSKGPGMVAWSDRAVASVAGITHVAYTAAGPVNARCNTMAALPPVDRM